MHATSHKADGYTLTIYSLGSREMSAELQDPQGSILLYDNPTAARADFLALTGVEA